MPDRSLRPDPRCLFAVVQDGLAVVAPDRELELELDAPFELRRRLLGLLVDGAGTTAIADAAEAAEPEAQELLDQLHEIGALAEEPPEVPPPPGLPLADAVAAAARGEPVVGSVWTGEELLLLPTEAPLEPGALRQTLRAFIAGIRSDARLNAYCYLATWREETVWGDRPGPDGRKAGEIAAEGLDPAAIHVVHLAAGTVESAAPASIGSLGAERPHRLGVVLSETDLELPGPLYHRLATYAIANLRHPQEATGRLGRGTADDPELASVIARAEAAERYAAGDVGRHELVRARASELDGPVVMDDLFRFNRRQLRDRRGITAGDPDEARLWIAARAPDGTERLVPAESVFMRVDDPERRIPPPVPSTSSGVAAHTDPAEVRRRAFCELIERDAFMWHWVQRVSRERIDPATLPPDLRDQLRQVEAGGFEAHLVNLTLDTTPVILCVLIGRGWICPGIASHPDATRAAGKSLAEATSIAWSAAVPDREVEPLAPEDVATPEEHLRLHHVAGLVEEDRFLAGTDERIGIDEIAAADGPIEEMVAAVGEPLTVELGSPATTPYLVIRALLPGIIPIAFGYDREPLGVPRLLGPMSLHDGRVLGAELDSEELGPLTPHPFP